MNCVTSYRLDRYLKAQERIYSKALQEITEGEKVSCWMWFIFPQQREVGSSRKSYVYGLDGMGEARAYLLNSLLRHRLIECCEALLKHTNKTAVDILGEVDAKKLHSSMTLFSAASDHPIFKKVLDHFFFGVKDPHALDLINYPSYFLIANNVLYSGVTSSSEVIIPNGITKIAKGAFADCKNIKSVIIPNSVKEIGSDAFLNCTNLRFIYIPETTNCLARNAFKGCYGLSDNEGFVIVNQVLHDYFSENEHPIIPKHATTIGSSAFLNKNIKSVTIPSTINEISETAFLNENLLFRVRANSYAHQFSTNKNLQFVLY